MEKAGATPLEPFPGAHTPWRCKCHECGEIRTPRLTNIRQDSGPCGPCAQRRRLKRELAEAEPQAVADMEKAGATPLEPFPGTHTPWRCKCHECGVIREPLLSSVRSGRGPCGPCAQRRRGKRQLAEAEPQAIADMEAAGATPVEPFPGTQTPWRCKCHECGEIREPWLTSIRQGAGPCDPCGKRRRGKRQIAEAEPQAIAEMEAAGATPLEPFPGVHNPWRCACHECGLIITPQLADIRGGNQRRPCWSCANDARKFDIAVRAIADPEQWETPGVLYLVRLRFDDGASSLKLGISTEGKLYRGRLDRYRRATGHEPEPLGEWFAPRALCVWVEHQHHSERAGALKEYALDLTEKLPSGGNETYTDTPETVALFLDSVWWMGTRPAEPFDDLLLAAAFDGART